MRRSATRLSGLAAVVVTFAVHTDASADVQDKAYEDVKAVMEQLMQQEVAETIVPNMACAAPPSLLVYYPRSMQRIYERRFGQLKSVFREESAELAASYVYHVLRAAVSPAAEEAGDRTPEWFLLYGTEDWQPRSAPECADAIRSKGGPEYFVRWALGDAQKACDSQDVLTREACQASAKPNKLFSECENVDLTRVGGAAIGGETIGGDTVFRCEVSRAVQDAVLGRRKEMDTHLRKVLAMVVVSRLGKSTTSESRRLADIASYVNVWLSSNADPDSGQASLWWAQAAGTSLSTDDLLWLKGLRTRWHLMTQDGSGSFDPLSFVDVILSAWEESSGGDREVVKTIKALKDLGMRSRHFRTALRDAFRNEGRDFAAQSVVACFGPRDKRDSDTVKRHSVYARFLSSIAAYIADGQEDGAPSETAREAFRTAAFDVLRDDGPRSGFNRGWWLNTIIPQPTLRLSWNQGYINEVANDGFRYVGTLDWPNFRIPLRYDRNSYAVVNVSLLDPIAPFSEPALRDRGLTYTRPGNMYANILSPRVEIMFGIPSLSKHLVATAGVSVRGSVAFRDPSAAPTAAYYFLLNRPAAFDDDKTNYYAKFFEGSVGLKYIP